MQPVNPKWQESGLVLVCEKCYKQRIPEEAPDVAARIGDFNLRDWLKSELKARGEWGPIRVVGTTCLDVCSRENVTVALDPRDGRATVTLILDPVEEREALRDRIVREMGRKATPEP